MGTDSWTTELMVKVTWSTYNCRSARLEIGEGRLIKLLSVESRRDLSLLLSAFFQFRQGAGGVRGRLSGRLSVVMMAAWSEEWECSSNTSVTHGVARLCAAASVQTRSIVVFVCLSEVA